MSCRFLADLLGAFPFEVIAGGSFNEQERLQLTMLRGLKCLRLVRLARSDMRAGSQLTFEWKWVGMRVPPLSWQMWRASHSVAHHDHIPLLRRFFSDGCAGYSSS